MNCVSLANTPADLGSWWGSRREGDHWGGLGIDGWIILGWISKR